MELEPLYHTYVTLCSSIYLEDTSNWAFMNLTHFKRNQKCFTHQVWVKHICISKVGHHWLSECLIVNCTLVNLNKFQWKLNQNTNIFIHNNQALQNLTVLGPRPIKTWEKYGRTNKTSLNNHVWNSKKLSKCIFGPVMQGNTLELRFLVLTHRNEDLILTIKISNVEIRQMVRLIIFYDWISCIHKMRY